MELTTLHGEKLEIRSVVARKVFIHCFLDFERYLDVAILNFEKFQMEFDTQIILLLFMFIALIRQSFIV